MDSTRKRRPQAVPRVQAFTGRDIDAAEMRADVVQAVRFGMVAIPVWLAAGVAVQVLGPMVIRATAGLP